MTFSHLNRFHHFMAPIAEPLHVIVPYFNPMRYLSRVTLHREFVAHATSAGATVWVIEIAYGSRPFEVTEPNNPRHIQLRSDQELWHKESMINIAIKHLPADWKYVAWIDGDVAFVNTFWVQETIQQLQHYCIVQMFETAHDINPNGHITNEYTGYVASIMEGLSPVKDYYYYGVKGKFHPGYAWASNREAWNTIGGLLDVNIIGGGDHQMAHALYGTIRRAIPFKCTNNYRSVLLAWEKNALKLNKNIGFVPGTLLHHWHGKKISRHYFDRWKILANNQFDPITDIKRDWQGLWQLTQNKPRLRDEIMGYFRSRQEDGISII